MSLIIPGTGTATGTATMLDDDLLLDTRVHGFVAKRMKRAPVGDMKRDTPRLKRAPIGQMRRAA